MGVILFNNETYDINRLREMTPNQLYEQYLADDTNVAFYETLKAYETDHNDGCLKFYKGWYLFFINE